MSRLLPLLLAVAIGPILLPALLSSAAWAESGVVLPLPDRFGEIQAGTFDEQGSRLGDAKLTVEQLPDGKVRLEARSRATGFSQTVVTALLEPTEDGRGLRMLSQTSRSKDEEGNDLGLLAIDHVRREASCAPNRPGGERAVIPLPSPDRVVNVPHNLFFQPLVRREVEELDFQLLLCRTGARLVDVKARIAEDSDEVIEVRYNMQLGPMLSRLAAPFLPRLSVWFDPQDPSGWVGQRFPLFSKGPTVIVVRTGFDPGVLGANP